MRGLEDGLNGAMTPPPAYFSSPHPPTQDTKENFFWNFLQSRHKKQPTKPRARQPRRFELGKTDTNTTASEPRASEH